MGEDAGQGIPWRPGRERAAGSPPAAHRERIPKSLEDLIILLLGPSANPMPSPSHLQAEMFMLAQVNPKFRPLIRFERSRDGPYSDRLREASSKPAGRAGAYELDPAGRLRLTEAGRRMFDERAAEAGPDGKLASLLIAVDVIRMLYDKMTADEVAFLIYDTYPEVADRSGAGGAFEDAAVRRRLADSLLKKDLIVPERWSEMVAGG